MAVDDGLRWPDLEALVIAHLAPLADWVSTDTPAVIAGRTGLRVTVATGTDDGLNDSSLVDVEAFAPQRGQSSDLAGEARAAMHTLTGRAVNGDLVDRVATAVRPSWVDYRNPAVHRFVAAYRVVTRAQ